jgi:inositol hexakisphosphate/diphosphoinositol-pentakisphosphate kinase
MSPTAEMSTSAAIKDDEEWRDEHERLKIVRTVLEAKGHFSGVNRKVQFQPKFGEKDVVSWLLIVKWGGELTALGKKQAIYMGSDFRKSMYCAHNNKTDLAY